MSDFISRRNLLKLAKRSLIVAAPSLILPRRTLAQIGPPPVLVPMAPIPWANLTRTFLSGGTQLNGANFTSVPFGVAAANRYLICCCGSTASPAISGLTIGGVTATAVVSASQANCNVLIGVALVPIGTSGTVTFSLGANGTSGYGLYSVNGLANPSSPLTASTLTSPFSNVFAALRGSVIIACYVNFNNGVVVPSWSAGVTQDDFLNQPFLDQSVASGVANNGGNITVTGASGGAFKSAAAAVWHS